MEYSIKHIDSLVKHIADRRASILKAIDGVGGCIDNLTYGVGFTANRSKYCGGLKDWDVSFVLDGEMHVVRNLYAPLPSH